MTRAHRAAHVWLWLAVGGLTGAAFAVWLLFRVRGDL